MTRHLQSEEISRYLVGDLAPELESHAHQCPECKARLVRLEASLAGFRGTVRNFKENEFMTTYKMHTGNETMAGLSSLLIHCGVVAMLLMLGTLKPVQHFMKQSVTLVAPNLKPYEARKSGGGGGGGDRSPLEASQGKLPKVAPRQFTPPRVDAENAKLPMAPTIIAPSDVPNITATNGRRRRRGAWKRPGRGAWHWRQRQRRCLQNRRWREFARDPYQDRAGIFRGSPQGEVARNRRAIVRHRRHWPRSQLQNLQSPRFGLGRESDGSGRQVDL
jgi:hypothetical protein